MKKFLMTILLTTAIIFSGCGSDTATFNERMSGAQASPVAEKIPEFLAKTIDGDPVTQEIFAAKKITVVNIWGTFCPPCIAEMPELGEMARNLPDDVQIIGLVCDASEKSAQIQKAQQIVQQSGANFVNIIPDDRLIKFIEHVEAVPTTIFVNSKGEVVGKAIIGANVKGYRDELEKLLQ